MRARQIGCFSAAWKGWLAAIGFVIATMPMVMVSPIVSVAFAQVFTETPTPPKSNPKAKPKLDKRAKGKKQGARNTAKQGDQPTRLPAQQRVPTYADPALFCTAATNSDVPDVRYVGQPLPSWIGDAITAQAAKSNQQLNQAYSWRCMDGRVFACASSAGEDGCSRPSAATEPSEAIRAYCGDRRRGKVPDVVAGNTVTLWSCKDKNAIVLGNRGGIDHQGFDGARWLDITEFAPTSRLGDMPRRYSGKWIHTIKPSLLSVLGQELLLGGRPVSGVQLRAVVFEISGGTLGQSIGLISYYIADQQGNAQLLCKADMLLLSATPLQLEFEEHVRRDSPSQCTGAERLTLQPKDGKLFIQWRIPGSTKPRRSGWADRVAD